MKFIKTRATGAAGEEAVLTAHEERPCSLHGVAAFLSLQSRPGSIAQEFEVIVRPVLIHQKILIPLTCSPKWRLNMD